MTGGDIMTKFRTAMTVLVGVVLTSALFESAALAADTWTR